MFPTEHLFFPHTASTSHFLVQTLIISPKTKKEFRPHLLPKRQVGPTCITDSLSPQRAVVSPPVRMLASPLQVSQIPSPICGPAPTVSRPRTPGSNPPTPRAPSPTAWTHLGGAHRQWEMGRGAPTWEQRGFSGLPVAARLNNGHPFPPLSQNSPKRAASPLLLPNPYASRTFSKLPLPPPLPLQWRRNRCACSSPAPQVRTASRSPHFPLVLLVCRRDLVRGAVARIWLQIRADPVEGFECGGCR